MPCYLVIDGKKQKMDEDIFDQMVEALHPPTVQEPPIQTSTRWQPARTFVGSTWAKAEGDLTWLWETTKFKFRHCFS